MAAPDYLVVGHIAKDRLAGGVVRAGGTALYAGLTAQCLGAQAAMLTALAPADSDLLVPVAAAGMRYRVLPSPATTTYVVEYDAAGRRLCLEARAAPLHPDDVPAAWRSTPILHLGPVAAEMDGTADWPACCPSALIGVTPQGWLRTWDAGGWMHPAAWPSAAAVLAHADVLIMSGEDVGNDEAALLSYVRLARLAVVTAGPDPAAIYERGRLIATVPACHAVPVDLTGAGDVFGAAFLLEYRAGGDAERAARFAHAAAAFAIEGAGSSGIAGRAEVEARVAARA